MGGLTMIRVMLIVVLAIKLSAGPLLCACSIAKATNHSERSKPAGCCKGRTCCHTQDSPTESPTRKLPSEPGSPGDCPCKQQSHLAIVSDGSLSLDRLLADSDHGTFWLPVTVVQVFGYGKAIGFPHPLAARDRVRISSSNLVAQFHVNLC